MTIDGKTQLYGLLGWPVGHSLSPVMHNAAAAALGLNLAYVPLPVAPAQLPAAVRGLAALGFHGANVTVPHKEAVVPLLDELSVAASAIGAINTITVAGGALLGDNTDWSGFLADLRALDLALDGRDCLVLGAGGAARAVVYALLRAGGCVHVLARRAGQAAALAVDLLSGSPAELPGPATASAGSLDDLPDLATTLAAPLVVNTTPLGMAPEVDRSPWPDGLAFPAGAFAYDLVYNPAQTRFMAQAVAGGSRAANGLGMLVAQAAEAFELWTGYQPDAALMRRTAEAELARRTAAG